MVLAQEDAATLTRSILEHLREIGAEQVLDGIDESRRLGIEEILPEQKGSDLRQVARTRRRPPNDREMLHIVLERLSQRLIALPAIGMAIRRRIGTGNVLWSVDTEFISSERFPEARLTDLSPDGVEKIAAGWNEIVNAIAASVMAGEA